VKTFTLRQEHLDSFDAMYRETFEDRMLRDIAERFYPQFEAMGEEKVRDRICDGIERAARYEIHTQRDVAQFIRLMFGIRPDFDTSRKTPFAAEILKQTDRPAMERLEEIKMIARHNGVRQPK
jgi:rubrerythrin